MDDEYSPIHNRISDKKLAALFGLSVFGAFIFIQALYGFPLKDFIRKEITEEIKVIVKNAEGTCMVETSDRPRSIPSCEHNVGEVLVVAYKEGTQPIENHWPKQ